MIIGWSFVERNDGYMHLCFAMGSQLPGEITCQYWLQPVTSATFRRTFGLADAPAPLELELSYVNPGRFRDRDNREFTVGSVGYATDLTIVPVLQPTKRVPAGTRFVWDATWAVWQREYKTAPYLRAVPRILGDEQAVPKEHQV